MENQLFDFGMIGLGTMGRNLVFNMCHHGYSVAGYDKDQSKVTDLQNEKGTYNLSGINDLSQFVQSLKMPRVILMLVPAGPIVDSVIDELRPLISENDLIIDCGNSHFTDTDRRITALSKEHIHFMGIGISGGETGARFGPSIMPGGNKESYERIAAMLSAVAAKVDGDPCVTFIGNGSAGHYVKMVHNGIEYALMQAIAESYQLLKEIAGLGNKELHDVYQKWNKGVLQSYLIEITAAIFSQKDDAGEAGYLIDKILDSAHQKGTGKWMSQNSMDIQVPVPTIDAAVAARDLSALKDERKTISEKLKGPAKEPSATKSEFIDQVEKAICFSMITTFAQGISLLQRASAVYEYNVNPAEVLKIWRGGCIIRAAVLNDLIVAFKNNTGLTNLMLDNQIAYKLMELQKSIRNILTTAIANGIPVPALMASMAYFDGFRTERLPSNLIQAQRDFFGAHTYERTDLNGTFHTQWDQEK
ncbi:MAG: NADP-dependent phosphogluconate dehydrogenase [Chloroflexota bacterium]